MWFVHKPPGVRLRFEADDPATTLEPVLDPWLIDVERRSEVRGFRFGVYEPEEHRFGGPVGMALAHELFDLDTTLLLPSIAGGLAAEERARWGVRATQSLLRGAVDDWAEAWDVWRRLQVAVAELPDDAPAPPLAGVLDAADSPSREIGARLRACADAGRLSVGVRQWCTDAAVFGWNRLGMGFWPGVLRATVEAVTEAHP
jgi:hypothetical protein